jgi:transcriptional regulator with XRE-family HTH domain
MTMAVKENRRAMPAKKPVEQTTYNGRFAERLRELRDGRDVDAIIATIHKAGFKRCSKATYYNWEGGVYDPPIAALPALAKALGVSIPELFPAK